VKKDGEEGKKKQRRRREGQRRRRRRRRRGTKGTASIDKQANIGRKGGGGGTCGRLKEVKAYRYFRSNR
jgi:hypothetical protein